MIIDRYIQSPNEKKVYRLDYASWLRKLDGDIVEKIVKTNIVTSPITSPSLLASAVISDTKTDIALTVSSGVADKTYIVKVAITTSDGQIKEDCVEVGVLPACV